MSAVNSDWYPGGYSSRRFLTTTTSCPNAVEHLVLWESQFSGYILLPEDSGSIGVEGVSIHYELIQHLDARSIRGSTETDKSGYFQIALSSVHMNQRKAKLIIRPSKTSNDVDHLFAHGVIPLTGLPCCVLES